MRHALLPALALVVAACAEEPEDPSLVEDLRVLGMRLEPPELMSPQCVRGEQAPETVSAPVQLTTLIADPAGNGRPLSYELLACASPADRTCSDPATRVRLAAGEVAVEPGREAVELSLRITPGLAQVADGAGLLDRVLEQDAYGGLGGLRMPLVLRLSAGSEELYAQKLMVFSCRFFPESAPNANPVLPVPMLKGSPWEESHVPTLSELQVELSGLSAGQEAYVVPAFDLSKVELRESWSASWFSTLGSFSPRLVGPLGDTTQARWYAAQGAADRQIRIWLVVRDGRGGMSWITRSFRYQP